MKYEKLAGAFEGFQGFHVETPEQIEVALRAALQSHDKPTLINLLIDPAADRKAQVNSLWFTFDKIFTLKKFQRNFHG